jgi:hypothetical protein
LVRVDNPGKSFPAFLTPAGFAQEILIKKTPGGRPPRASTECLISSDTHDSRRLRAPEPA